MLAVALVPLVIMTFACLLERLEARAVPGEGTRATRRAAATSAATSTTPTGSARVEQAVGTATERTAEETGRAEGDAVPTGRHLRLLPALAEVTATARASASSAADTLRRAS